MVEKPFGKILPVLPVVLVLAFCMVGMASAKEKLPRLAVLDLEAKYGIERDYAEALSVLVRDEIYSYKKYSVLSQQDLAAVMSREQILQAMGCAEGSTCLNDFGKALGSEYMVAGAVSKIGGVWSVSLRLLDTQGKDAGLVNRVSMNRKCDEEGLIDLVKEVSASLIGVKSSAVREQARLAAERKRAEEAKQQAELEARRSTLTVRTEPSGASVRILNIRESYRSGMRLDPGRYQLEVSRSGYTTMRQWLELPPGQDYVTTIRLQGSGPNPGDGFTDPTTGMEFVYVKGGCFQMGSPSGESGRDSDEGPLHQVCVDDFWMGKYEVTNRQFRKFSSGHSSTEFRGKSLNGDQQPAVYVSWDDATAFGRWLSSSSGKRYRLPTEAEWEYAARAGTTTARFWGNDPDDACRYANVHDVTSKRVNKFDWTSHNCDDGFAVTAPVGSFQPNNYGLYDMLGNVWEWCQDWYGKNYYASSPRNNPQGVSSGASRVLRGGSWASRPWHVRAANRGRRAPVNAYNYLGFRLVLPVQ